MKDQSAKIAPVNILSEAKVQRYYELHNQAKKIEYELNELRKDIHTYMDQLVGQQEKGSFVSGDIQVQRQVRTSVQYDQEKTVQRLEDLQLHDCIETIRKPDSEKIEAAIKLGLLSEDVLVDCKLIKAAQAIVVRKITP